MSRHLFLFQIGPVQAFIAQARRTQDLFIGSYTLSQLASAGLKVAINQPGFNSIFPFVENGQVPQGVPHRFAFVCEGNPHDVAKAVEDAIQTHWQTFFVHPVYRVLNRNWGKGEWQAIFNRQANSWMEFYWVAVAYDNHQESMKAANVALGQRKTVRSFYVVDEPGIKCTLTGSQSALIQGDNKQVKDKWKQINQQLRNPNLFRDNENLGTMATIKRLVAPARSAERIEIPDYESFPSTTHIAKDDPDATEDAFGDKDVSGYLAVLHMDGDKMGVRLSELTRLEEHQEFSRNLTKFASTVQNIIDEYGGSTGRLVYAGGDDVLALLPLKHVLKCADEIRKAFDEITGLHASAGIAITPYDLPLDRALEMARDAESTAKEGYHRNALCVVEAHGTGQMREAGAKWDALATIQRWQKHFEGGFVSGKLAYDLRVLDSYLFGSTPEMIQARTLELKRLVKQRTTEQATAADREMLVQDATDLLNLVGQEKPIPSWSDMANWLILARFLSQGGRRESSLEEVKS